jgi:hypothetical protein
VNSVEKNKGLKFRMFTTEVKEKMKIKKRSTFFLAGNDGTPLLFSRRGRLKSASAEFKLGW